MWSIMLMNLIVIAFIFVNFVEANNLHVRYEPISVESSPTPMPTQAPNNDYTVYVQIDLSNIVVPNSFYPYYSDVSYFNSAALSASAETLSVSNSFIDDFTSYQDYWYVNTTELTFSMSDSLNSFEQKFGGSSIDEVCTNIEDILSANSGNNFMTALINNMDASDATQHGKNVVQNSYFFSATATYVIDLSDLAKALAALLLICIIIPIICFVCIFGGILMCVCGGTAAFGCACYNATRKPQQATPPGVTYENLHQTTIYGQPGGAPGQPMVYSGQQPTIAYAPGQPQYSYAPGQPMQPQYGYPPGQANYTAVTVTDPQQPGIQLVQYPISSAPIVVGTEIRSADMTTYNKNEINM